MRLNIKFKLSGKEQVLPFNYQYPISAWIYKVLSSADESFTRMLHDHGYVLENGKTFKMFTFSKIVFPKNKWKILSVEKVNDLRHNAGYKPIKNSDRMRVWARNAYLQVSFHLPEQTEKFVMGLFNNQRVFIGDKISGINMEVETIEVTPYYIEPKDYYTIRAKTPVVIGLMEEGKKYEEYIPPIHHDFSRLFIKNLLDKYALSGKTDVSISDITFEPLSMKPKTGKQTIKAFEASETEVRGFYFDFKLSAPKELIEIGLNAGFGSMNSLGFGFGEIVEEENRN